MGYISLIGKRSLVTKDDVSALRYQDFAALVMISYFPGLTFNSDFQENITHSFRARFNSPLPEYTNRERME